MFNAEFIKLLQTQRQYERKSFRFNDTAVII